MVVVAGKPENPNPNPNPNTHHYLLHSVAELLSVAVSYSGSYSVLGVRCLGDHSTVKGGTPPKLASGPIRHATCTHRRPTSPTDLSTMDKAAQWNSLQHELNRVGELNCVGFT